MTAWLPKKAKWYSTFHYHIDIKTCNWFFKGVAICHFHKGFCGGTFGWFWIMGGISRVLQFYVIWVDRTPFFKFGPSWAWWSNVNRIGPSTTPRYGTKLQLHDSWILPVLSILLQFFLYLGKKSAQIKRNFI